MIEWSRPTLPPATGNHATRPHDRAPTHTIWPAAFGFLYCSPSPPPSRVELAQAPRA
jgi:hypothetical protein